MNQLYRIRIVDRGKKRWILVLAEKLKSVALRTEGDSEGDIAGAVVESPHLQIVTFEDEMKAGAKEIWWEN